MTKGNRIIYKTLKVLFSIIILIGTITYFANYELVSARVANLGYPTYIIYPLGILKVLGLLAIWFSKSELLKEWAYAGFGFVLVLAVAAHIGINDNEFQPALIGLIFGVGTYLFHRKELSTI